MLAFKLGADGRLPVPAALSEPGELPEEVGDATMVEAGRIAYAQHCWICHGIDAVSGGVIPYLRYSAMNVTAAAWKAVVLDGSLEDKGMVSFAANLSVDEAEAVRAYVVRRAHESQ